MSTVKGVNKTLIDLGTTLSPGLFDGRVKIMIDTYEADSLTQPSTITMGGRLTKGCVILTGILITDTLGGSTTISVGDAAVPARYISTQSTASTVSTSFDVVDGVGYTTTESDPDALDTQIVLTLGGATATGTIKLILFYTND